MQANYINETELLNFNSPNIQTLVLENNWQALTLYDRIGAVYSFVKDKIKFGYNFADAIPASQILQDGIGQCNTKAILLMALFRAVDIPCRLHGFTIDKSLQRGVVPELIYPITPDNILHSWVEVFYKDKWINLEGFILDVDYLRVLQNKYNGETSICAYGAGTDNLAAPMVEWQGTDTYIQKTGINQDFGVFNDPDDFFDTYQQNLSSVKQVFYQFFIRHWMNMRVKKLRGMKTTANPVIPAPTFVGTNSNWNLAINSDLRVCGRSRIKSGMTKREGWAQTRFPLLILPHKWGED